MYNTVHVHHQYNCNNFAGGASPSSIYILSLYRVCLIMKTITSTAYTYNVPTYNDKMICIEFFFFFIYVKFDQNKRYKFSMFMQGLGLWCLEPLSTIFQLYRDCQFYCWRKLE